MGPLVKDLSSKPLPCSKTGHHTNHSSGVSSIFSHISRGLDRPQDRTHCTTVSPLLRNPDSGNHQPVRAPCSRDHQHLCAQGRDTTAYCPPTQA